MSRNPICLTHKHTDSPTCIYFHMFRSETMHIIAMIMHPKFIKKSESQLPFLLMFIDNVDWWVDKILRILNIQKWKKRKWGWREMMKNCTMNLWGLCGEVEDQTKIRGSSPKGPKINISLSHVNRKEKDLYTVLFFLSCLKSKSNQITTDQNKELRNEVSRTGTDELWIYLNMKAGL